MKTSILDAVCEPRIEMCDPRRARETEFTYIDISSVDNVAKRIMSPSRIKGAVAPSRARQRVQTGDVLVATTRPNLNAVALVSAELDGQIASTGFCVLRSKMDRLSPEFLHFWVRHPSFVESLSSLVQGALYPAVSDRQVREQAIPLPPLARQREIVARLDSQLAAATRARTAVAAQLADADKLEAAFNAEVFSSAEVAQVPKGRLSDLCEIGTGTTPSRNIAAYFGIDHPWLTPGDLGREVYVEKSREGLSELGVREGRGYLFPARTVLLVCIGATIGKVSIASVPAAANQQVNGLTCGPELWPEFLLFWLKTQRARLFDDGGSVTLPIVNQKGLGRYELPLPPLPVQKRLSADLLDRRSAARALTAQLTARLADLDRLPAALLREAFAG